ncbi:hypothetical protein HY095_04780 [Candidatus Micrarchaeota archaeon]|nr:hypothetical protein [Candidatus Micrarchaeota archaeon]
MENGFRALAAALVFASLFAHPAASSYVKIIEPVQLTVQASQAGTPESEIDLGLVGPGQTVELIASRSTGEISRNNETQSRNEATWDQVEVLRDKLPLGWVGQDSLRFEDPMKPVIVVAKQAPDGEYEFILKARDDYEGTPPLYFNAKARVSRSVLEARIAGEPVKAEPRSQVAYQIELNNLGSANDVFEVKVSGVPKELETGKTFLVPHNSKKTFDFTIQAPESGEFPLTFTVTSLSSPAITSTARTTLFVGSSLLTDMKAAARGVLLFPSAQVVAYSLLAFIGSVMR